jgi:SpoVK/Ycf46/Vps4 family AAA+-type ATPase
MPRSDLVLSLVKAGATGDQGLLKTTVEALAADERAKQHHQLADRLVENLRTASRNAEPSRLQDGGHGGLVFQVEATRTIASLVLDTAAQRVCDELIEEQRRADLLRSFSLEPRHRVLLQGPPGNGKTSLAEAIAYELAVPLFVVRYEAIIGSFLGETSSRLRKLFDFARTHPCVLFFDEFDTLGKERGDIHETGEIKRVVSSLLLQIDALPSYVVVVTATNHPELLDRAVWRRFEIQLNLPPPSRDQSVRWIKGLQREVGLPFGMSAEQIARLLKPNSFSALEAFALDLKRRVVLAGPGVRTSDIIKSRLSTKSMSLLGKGKRRNRRRGST